MSEERKAEVISSGEKVKVKRHSYRHTWIDIEDYNTEYKTKELKFL